MQFLVINKTFNHVLITGGAGAGGLDSNQLQDFFNWLDRLLKSLKKSDQSANIDKSMNELNENLEKGKTTAAISNINSIITALKKVKKSYPQFNWDALFDALNKLIEALKTGSKDKINAVLKKVNTGFKKINTAGKVSYLCVIKLIVNENRLYIFVIYRFIQSFNSKS